MPPSDHTERIQQQFTKQADAYAATEQARDEQSMAALVGIVGATPDDRALDVACGPGVLTRAFAERSASAVGCDVTEALLEKARSGAREKGISNVTFRRGDATSLPFEDAAFTIAACRAAFHHFEQAGDVLAEMRRVVQPGGSILVADIVTSEDAETAELHNAVERLCDPTHVRALPRSELEQLFADAKLTVERLIPTELHYDLEEWIGHGGPDTETAGEIRKRMGAWLENDSAGLKVRAEDGRIKFSHQAVIVVAKRPD